MLRSCPACDDTLVYRVTRKGRLEPCLSLLFIYPFRCKACSHRFRAFKWSHYVKVKQRRNRRQ